MRRKLTLSELRRVLASYGVQEDRSRGKGSHTYFWKKFPEGVFGYPVPVHGKDVKSCYVANCRKKFRLTPADNVSDDEFFGRV